MTLRLVLAPSIGTARAQARAELLEDALGTELGEPVEIEIAANYGELEQHARDATADLVWAPPAVVARVEALSLAIFKCVRSGTTSYRSAIVARKGEGTSLTSGTGLRAVWTDPMSIGGCLLALDHIERLGLDADRLFASQLYVGSYPEALDELLHEKADLTAIGVHSDRPEHVDEALARFAGRMQAGRLEAIAVTRETPADALVVTERLDPEKARKFGERLVPAAPGRAPQGICLALEVEGFARAEPGEYEPVRELVSRI